mgnify:CR=1 FL=1
MGGCQLEQEGDNFYIVGADSVRKKLGDEWNDLTVTIPTNIWVYGNRGESANIIIKISRGNGNYMATIVSAGNSRLHHLSTGDIGFLANSVSVSI